MRAITHPGGAHADDVLTAAYLIVRGVDRIDRREPTVEELEDWSVLVFDVGGRHEPDNLNFDHHQFTRDSAAACALTLVLDFHNDYDDWQSIFPWVKGMEVMDSKGPFAVAATLGVEFDALKPYVFNPFAGFVIDQFAKQETHLAGEPVFELLGNIGSALCDKVVRLRDKWRKFDITTQIVPVRDINVGVFATTGPEGIETWLQRRSMSVQCVVSDDDRGSGLSLFRKDDDPRLDFSRCENMDNVTFAHKNGFVAKISDGDWRPVVEQALVGGV